MRLKRIKHIKNIYHISEENHNGEIFRPRVPNSYCDFQDDDGNDYEDGNTKRVCFSRFISGAVLAINFNNVYGEEYYVHVPENLSKCSIVKPSDKQCFDASFTNEYWAMNKVKMKTIGKIKVWCDMNIPIYYESDKPKVRFKWIEKYC